MEAPIAELAIGIQRFRQLANCNVASFTVLVLEYLITFNLEISMIWKSNWSIMKVLFLLARYMPFVDLILIFYLQYTSGLDRHTCKAIHSGITWLFGTGVIVAEMILTLRTWAVWGKDKWLTIILPTLLVALSAAALAILGVYLNTTIYEPSPVPQLLGCVVRTPNSLLSGCYIILMVYDGVTLLLMAIRAFSAFKQGTSHLMVVVYRDGIIYYVYLFVLALVNVIVINKLPNDALLLLVTIERVAHSVLACRVVLHLREQANVTTYGATSDIGVYTD